MERNILMSLNIFFYRLEKKIENILNKEMFTEEKNELHFV